EWRRRAAVRQPVLIAVPGTGDAAVDDTALADRPVLVRAQVGQRADLVTVAEHRDAFAVARHDDTRAFVRNGFGRTDRDPAVTRRRAAIGYPFAPAGD